MAVTPFVQDLSQLRTLYGQSAQHKRPGSEPEFLGSLLSLQPHASNRLGLAKLLLGNEQFPWKVLKDCSGRLKASIEIVMFTDPSTFVLQKDYLAQRRADKRVKGEKCSS